MKKEEFANKILKISYSHWQFVLNGQRGLGLQKARVAAAVLNTPIEVWIDPEMGAERVAAWKSFSS